MQRGMGGGNHRVWFLVLKELSFYRPSINMAKQMGLQVHEAVTPNPKAMNKADKDLPCKNVLFFLTHYIHQHTRYQGMVRIMHHNLHGIHLLAGENRYLLGNKWNARVVDRQEKSSIIWCTHTCLNVNNTFVLYISHKCSHSSSLDKTVTSQISCQDSEHKSQSIFTSQISSTDTSSSRAVLAGE